MLVNKMSGRSFNDMSQYPIFPWVIADYSSHPVEFLEAQRNDLIYRDLKKHTGNISEYKIADSEHNWEDSSDPDMACINVPQYGIGAFHMRVGMSASMRVSEWFCRLEPFATLSFNFHKDRDERMPIDFQKAFDYLCRDKQFNSELMPEMFYIPEVFMNLNKMVLGNQKNLNKQSDDEPETFSIDNIFLPPWALNYYDFVRIQREALESKSVQKNLAHWIDLVFGCN